MDVMSVCNSATDHSDDSAERAFISARTANQLTRFVYSSLVLCCVDKSNPKQGDNESSACLGRSRRNNLGIPVYSLARNNVSKQPLQ